MKCYLQSMIDISRARRASCSKWHNSCSAGFILIIQHACINPDTYPMLTSSHRRTKTPCSKLSSPFPSATNVVVSGASSVRKPRIEIADYQDVSIAFSLAKLSANKSSQLFSQTLWMSDPEGCFSPSIFHQLQLLLVLRAFTRTACFAPPPPSYYWREAQDVRIAPETCHR